MPWTMAGTPRTPILFCVSGHESGHLLPSTSSALSVFRPAQNVCQSTALVSVAITVSLPAVVTGDVFVFVVRGAVRTVGVDRRGSRYGAIALDVEVPVSATLNTATASRRTCACWAIDCAAADASSTSAAFCWVTSSICVTATLT
jgi:hypothetical protein